jgi:hypothetical protein
MTLWPIAEFYEKYVNSASEVNNPSYEPETNEYLLFVHGYALSGGEKNRWAETVFKRLWWQGYKGRVGCFQWPCQGVTEFNDSELMAWDSGDELLGLLATNLFSRFNGQIRVIAHSQGNVVIGESLRTVSGAPILHSYIAMQGALSAHCYDNSLPDYWPNYQTPNIYGYYATGTTGTPPTPPYFTGNGSAVQNMVNYFNPNDWALNLWQDNNEWKPLDLTGYWYDDDHGGLGTYHPPEDRFSALYHFITLTIPDDRFSIFAYCAESRSLPLGQASGVQGAFTGAQNTGERNLTGFGFDNTHYSHSLQFRCNIAEMWNFWSAVIGNAALSHNVLYRPQ